MWLIMLLKYAKKSSRLLNLFYFHKISSHSETYDVQRILKNSDILLQLARFPMWPNLNVQAQKIKHRTLNEFFPRTTHIKIYCAWGVNRWYNTTFCVGLYCLSSEMVCTASIIKTDITKHRTTLIPFLARWVKVWAFIMNDVCDIRLSLLFNLVK